MAELIFCFEASFISFDRNRLYLHIFYVHMGASFHCSNDPINLCFCSLNLHGNRTIILISNPSSSPNSIGGIPSTVTESYSLY